VLRRKNSFNRGSAALSEQQSQGSHRAAIPIV
jgi:hypothetical protein